MNEETVSNNRKEVKQLAAVFLGMLVLYFLVSGAQTLLMTKGIEMSLILTLILSELVMILPCLIYLLVKRLDPAEEMGFKKIRAGTVLLSILAAVLFMPLAVFLNLLSQLFVPNAAQEILFEFESSGSQILLIVGGGIIGPLCEELAFRGVLAQRYRKFVAPIAAVAISALFFGLIHMNFNQFLYAVALGIIFAIVNVASGSIFTSMIMHVTVNVLNIIPALLISDQLGADAQMTKEAAQAITQGPMMIILLIVYLGVAAIGTTLGGIVIYGIAKTEGRCEELKDIFKRHRNENVHPILNVFAIISICISAGVMIAIEII